jgi:hypothetical protein
MGICISQYRMVIGHFNICKLVISKCGFSVSLLSVNVVFFALVALILITIAGDIELNPGPDIGRFCKRISICHVNIRSLSWSKLHAIQTSLSNVYDIITLSETHLHAGISDDVFKLKGYQDIIRKDRPTKGGGVAIYLKENISYRRIFKYERNSLEAIWLQINTIEGKVLVCCCY